MSTFFSGNVLQNREKRLTLSTMITCVRIVLTPIIVYMIYVHAWYAAFGLFLLAALTDVLDGALARARGEQTMFGACLDPIADKILLISCFFALAIVKTPFFSIPSWFVWFVFGKELFIVGGTCVLYACGKHVMIMPTRLGKLVTFLQLCFIAWLFVCYFFSWSPHKTYQFTLFLLFCLIGATLLQYGRIGIRMWQST